MIPRHLYTLSKDISLPSHRAIQLLIFVEFGGKPGHVPSIITPMHLSLLTTFHPPIYWYAHTIFLASLCPCNSLKPLMNIAYSSPIFTKFINSPTISKKNSKWPSLFSFNCRLFWLNYVV